VLLWDREGQCKATLEGHDDAVVRLVWQGNDRLLSLGKDDRVCFWHVPTGKREKAVGPFPKAGRTGSNIVWTDLRLFSPDGRLLAIPRKNALQIWEVEGRRLLGNLSLLRAGPPRFFLAVTEEGHYRAPKHAGGHLVYVADTKRGQETLSPAEFAKRFGWKNDPERVRLTGK